VIVPIVLAVNLIKDTPTPTPSSSSSSTNYNFNSAINGATKLSRVPPSKKPTTTTTTIQTRIDTQAMKAAYATRVAIA